MVPQRVDFIHASVRELESPKNPNLKATISSHQKCLFQIPQSYLGSGVTGQSDFNDFLNVAFHCGACLA
jgi:hypothetical protein